MAAINNDPGADNQATELKERTFQKESELRDRLIFLAMDIAPGGRGAYKYLENRTGIPATRWKNVVLKRQMPTLAMLISLMDYRKPYAEWLLTGDDLGQGRSPSSERWESFLKHREWLQDHKANAHES